VLSPGRIVGSCFRTEKFPYSWAAILQFSPLLLPRAQSSYSTPRPARRTRDTGNPITLSEEFFLTLLSQQLPTLLHLPPPCAAAAARCPPRHRPMPHHGCPVLHLAGPHDTAPRAPTAATPCHPAVLRSFTRARPLAASGGRAPAGRARAEGPIRRTKEGGVNGSR
jgi:hypothetical protein